ncbi:MAG TPA: hypothetical protein V6C84_17805 [Coleofasciculaceae cyanobacterium]
MESFPAYRPGGRLENYRGHPCFSEGAFEILLGLVHRSAQNLEEFDRQGLSCDRSEAEKRHILSCE